MFAIGSQVCRKANRYRTVGTVVAVSENGCRVKWNTTQGGLVRIGSGTGISSFIKTDSLVAASEFVARPLSKPNPETATVVCYAISMPHPNGQNVGEYGVNWFRLSDEGEALAKHAELVAANPTVKVELSVQKLVKWTPEGCRKERERYLWETLS